MSNRLRYLGLSVLSLLLAGCVANMRPSSSTVILSDGAPEVDVDVTHLPDAVPKPELIKNSGNKTPYTVLGKTYHVDFKTSGFTQTGYASWYGKKFHGNKTSNGEIYDMYAMTAAHKTLPIPSYVRVMNLENGRSAIVRVNDRGPFHEGRIIDLSYAAAKKLGYHHKGTAKVTIEVIEQAQPALQVAEQNTTKTPPRQDQAGIVPMAGIVPIVQGVAVPVPTQTPKPQTYLQVGAFSKSESAADLRTRLTSALGTKVLVRPEPTQNLFKVLVGPILDNFELLTLRQKLADVQLPNAHIVEF